MSKNKDKEEYIEKSKIYGRLDTYYPSVNPNNPNEEKRREMTLEFFDNKDIFITGYYENGSSVEYKKRYEGGKLIEKTEYHKPRSNSHRIFGSIKKRK